MAQELTIMHFAIGIGCLVIGVFLGMFVMAAAQQSQQLEACGWYGNSVVK